MLGAALGTGGSAVSKADQSRALRKFLDFAGVPGRKH